jgi:predicted nucleotidyltransferase
MIPDKHGESRGMVSDELLADIVRRIVEVAQPERIILFGSAARSEMGPNSDIDVLVVKSGPVHRGRLTEAIYMNLLGLGQAVDVIVATPEDVKRYGETFCLVLEPALREGRVIYEREAVSTR